ncbi:FHA domain-containing protein [Lysobacter sp. KIS68-7]|uniref:FHA domain-containing protein n=1 Tax=Lysobacter sp. KIS68-7 TaxID=2904252 RepID=UPI001E5C7B62|nr:FHA domain-containing protein [Lysobacter sp. KIS68-7]UHQ18854.1 FHA domain-containing protein [Lysobacter sp. KIS68-7]
MLDFRAVDTYRLRFPNQNPPDAAIGPGLHGIGRNADGVLAPVEDTARMLAQLCVDRRGTWLKLGNAVRTVHVNGRPVKRMAMLRVGDAIYLDGTELLLLGAPRERDVLPPPGNQDGGDPRMLLRGVGGQYHGRSFTLERPRVVGRGPDADIRIDDPAFPERHARIEVQGGQVVMRGLPGAEATVVNGEMRRDAVLRTGDQLVFDAHHRFVVEAPGRPALPHDALAPALPDDIDLEHAHIGKTPGKGTVRRLPWLLLAALLIAGALSALLLFGSPG